MTNLHRTVREQPTITAIAFNATLQIPEVNLLSQRPIRFPHFRKAIVVQKWTSVNIIRMECRRLKYCFTHRFEFHAGSCQTRVWSTSQILETFKTCRSETITVNCRIINIDAEPRVFFQIAWIFLPLCMN